MTNNFPNIGYTTVGRDFNFFQKLSVDWSTFGGGSVSGQQPDMIITFPTQTVLFTNLSLADGYTNSNVIEYSFNGQTIHGELGSSFENVFLTFSNRVVSTIWFRVQSGSTSPLIVSVQAWGTR
jgi:hypothetical protein